MRTTLLTAVLCLLSFWMQAQKDPIALEYSIGAFRIPTNLGQQISERFEQLSSNKTYKVTIVGSADFLGSEDNNQVLSNKRVKFAEYYLLKHYRDLRLVIKLDSKGEMLAESRAKTKKGVQEHRMVYIYIEDYTTAQSSAPIAAALDNNVDAFNGRTVATAAAAQAEELGGDIPVSVSQSTPRLIKPISETAQIEIEKQKQIAAIEDQLRDVQQSHDHDHNTDIVEANQSLPLNSSSLNNTASVAPQPAAIASSAIDGAKEPRKFDGEGTFTVGEKLLLSDLNFRPGSHYLRPSSIPTLRKLIDVLEANPTVKIEIIGHICCHPDYSPHPDGFDREAGNNKLSFNRADNIKEYLQKNGIDASRVTATGMGAKERLVYPEETDEDRIKNRRVEIKIISI